MRDIVYVNGKFVPRVDAVVSIDDRGYQFADGVYEVIRFHGRRALRMDAHLQRLLRSSDSLRIKGCPTIEQWHSIIERLLEECGIPDDDTQVFTLYQQVTRGVCARVHVFPAVQCEPSAVAYFRSAPKYAPELRQKGIALSTQPDERWDRCFIKSICLLPSILAKQAAIDAGAFEALLVRNGYVTEGGSTNLFCVRDGVVYTHPEGPYILTGVTRTLVLEAVAQAGVEIRESPVTLEQFRMAQEAFVSSTTLDIMPCTSLDSLPIGNGQAGPTTRKLMAAFADIVNGELHQSVPA